MTSKIPSLHDGHLTGIRVRDATATAYVRDRSGTDLEVQLEGLKALQVENFRDGNIIVQFEVMKGVRPPSSIAWDRLFPSPHPSAERQYHERHSQFLEAEIAKIASGENSLVVVSPAYGADLLAVCREVSVRKA